MARSNRSQERFKYGICLNDECPKCKEKTVQQVPMRKDLVCSECGKEMRECPPPRKSNKGKRIAAIVAGVVALAAIILCIIYVTKSCGKTKAGGDVDTTDIDTTVVDTTATQPEGPDSTVTEPAEIELTLNHKTATLRVGDTDKLTVKEEGQFNFRPSKNGCLKATEDGTVTALKAGTSQVLVQMKDNPNAYAVCEYTILPKKEEPPVIIDPKPKAPTPLDLGYATYQGGITNGKPNGNGTLTFKRSYEIIPGSGDYAERGETVTGQFRDGKLIFGTWNKNDGNRKVVKR